ncbi:hypothetical protein E6H28_04215 [Candidatus Bathyarchaeota archaeon]|nr:MAG: hypothetical protein E6H28_04215 [Candidatus Bathyarchaeota archaeon]TMI53258.1 MAG: hypothetical protein E6H13_04320 [Candidatus Bathyarchaeota archaeon]
MQPITYSIPKGLRTGAIGGFIGAIVLGIFGEIGAMAMNQELFYTTIAKKLGFGDSYAVIGGWALHLLVGIIAGSLFVGATAAIRRFALTTTKKAVWVGILGGIVIWMVVYAPVTGILVPDDLTNTTFAGGSFVLHLLYGVVTSIVSLSLLRRKVPTKVAA